MDIKSMKKYLTPTTNTIGAEVLKWIKPFINQSHTGVLSGQNKDRKEKAVWFYRKDTDPSKIPTLVAHLDTVNPYDIAPTAAEIIIKDNIISLDPLSKASCLGGDDRAGLAIIIETMRALSAKKKPINFNILLTYGEEIGCLGTKEFLATKKEQFGASFMLEFDRRNGDFVEYNTGNTFFLNKLGTAYNRTLGRGSLSDITHFQRELKINSANIGVGFSNEHSKMETINFTTWTKTLNETIKLMEDEPTLKILGVVPWKDKVYTPYQSYTPAKKSLKDIFADFGKALDEYFEDKLEDFSDTIKETIEDTIEENFIVDTGEAPQTVRPPWLDEEECDHTYDEYNRCLWCDLDKSYLEDLAEEEEERKWYQSRHKKH